MKISAAFFSATQTTKTIVTEFVKNLAPSPVIYNLTCHPLTHDVLIPSGELLVVGMPVYGGRIPQVAVEALNRFKGEHTPAILVAVYGNREYEDAFVEMQDILETNGFFVCAAAAFIAQHSIFPHTAQGRPDQADFAKIHKFAHQCLQLVGHGFSPENKSIALPGNRPYKTPGKIPLKMVTSAACTACGACVKACPVQAIPSDHPQVTDYEKCIHCGHCSYVCTSHARHYSGMLYKVAGAVFGWKNRKRKEPEFFF